MIDSAMEILSRDGATAVTVEAVLARSEAPRGSVYHHFPGGRDELLLAAARSAADFLTQMLDGAAAAAQGPVELLDTFVEFWTDMLERSDYLAGCPIAAATVDHRTDLPELARLVADTYSAWQTRIAETLVQHGAGGADAARRSTFALAAVEGAILLCRAQRDTAPLVAVRDELRLIVGSPT